jgi:hypothetical protein
MPAIALHRYRGIWVGLEIVVPGRVLHPAEVARDEATECALKGLA